MQDRLGKFKPSTRQSKNKAVEGNEKDWKEEEGGIGRDGTERERMHATRPSGGYLQVSVCLPSSFVCLLVRSSVSWFVCPSPGRPVRLLVRLSVSWLVCPSLGSSIRLYCPSLGSSASLLVRPSVSWFVRPSVSLIRPPGAWSRHPSTQHPLRECPPAVTPFGPGSWAIVWVLSGRACLNLTPPVESHCQG